MKLLAISGSARRDSTNTALLRAVCLACPGGIEVELFDGLGALPIFSPDLEEASLPEPVQRFMTAIAECDGLIISSPEYVRTLPGGLKNAIDWLVSGDLLTSKPIALIHASHRGDDMLETLRAVLSTVSERFASGIFLRFNLVKMSPDEVLRVIGQPQNRAEVQAFLAAFSRYCQS